MIGFAHRGGRALAPDNTLAAFAGALRRGATGIETDVWLTADGVPVLSHDGTVAGRRISRTRRADLPAGVPALADLYATCGTGYALSVDIRDHDPATVPRVVAVARERGEPARLWLCGAGPAAKALDDRLHLVSSLSVTEVRRDLPGNCARLARSGVDAVNLRGGLWNRRRVRVAHEAGLRVFGWGAQSWWQLGWLAALGCDGVYCDDVDRMVTVLRWARRIRR